MSKSDNEADHRQRITAIIAIIVLVVKIYFAAHLIEAMGLSSPETEHEGETAPLETPTALIIDGWIV